MTAYIPLSLKTAFQKLAKQERRSESNTILYLCDRALEEFPETIEGETFWGEITEKITAFPTDEEKEAIEKLAKRERRTVSNLIAFLAETAVRKSLSKVKGS